MKNYYPCLKHASQISYEQLKETGYEAAIWNEILVPYLEWKKVGKAEIEVKYKEILARFDEI